MLWGKCGGNSLGSSCRILWHFDWLKHMGDWQPRTEEASTATALQLAMWLHCYSTATGHVTALLQHCNLPCDRIATALQLAMWLHCYSTATGHVTALLQHCILPCDCIATALQWPRDCIATALQLAMWLHCYSTATGHVTALLQHLLQKGKSKCFSRHSRDNISGAWSQIRPGKHCST